MCVCVCVRGEGGEFSLSFLKTFHHIPPDNHIPIDNRQSNLQVYAHIFSTFVSRFIYVTMFTWYVSRFTIPDPIIYVVL